MMRDSLQSRARWLALAQDNSKMQALLLEKCRRDILFWFHHFCWTFDPRLDAPHQPFVLYQYQDTMVHEITRCIDDGADLLIEKSRDMGVSWLVLLVFQYYWLFRPGANFHLGSRKQEYVDRKGDISTLFEKLRYNLDWLPAWMKPEGYNAGRHDNLLRMINPANGNSITGESSNENFARGGRYRGVLFDEFPFWDSADPAYASAGQSSPCRIVVGTPYGKGNRFADLRFGGKINIITAHWRLHPEKNDAWYEAQIQRMSEDEIARELDINYALSLKNRVFTGFTNEHQKRLILPPTDSETGRTRKILRAWDFGYHCPACLFIFQDERDRLWVLHEELGSQSLLLDFARQVQQVGEQRFPGWQFEDICDPAGAQRSDKSTLTSIEILNSLGIYPYYDRSLIKDGIELMRMKLAERPEGPEALPGLLVDPSCVKLIEAFEGGYRYASTDSDSPLQEHPYEDVMDCLRYAVMARCSVLIQNRKQARHYRPQNRHTGY